MNKTKEAIRGADYKQVYLFFYSFCKKLEDYAEPETIETYLKLANTLAKKSQVPKEEFFKIIKEISNLSNNINSYIPMRN